MGVSGREMPPRGLVEQVGRGRQKSQCVCVEGERRGDGKSGSQTERLTD